MAAICFMGLPYYCANQRFANDWPQPIVNIRWLA
jgi:hypothetical protein